MRIMLKTGQDNGLSPLSVLLQEGSLIDDNRFSWANGMFGQMILDLEKKRPYLLRESYQ